MVGFMLDVGIFEAKTKFPEVCDQVARSGLPVLIRRRGKPLVIISPASPGVTSDRLGILEEVRAWDQSHAQADIENMEDFPEVWRFRHDRVKAPVLEQQQ